uniref:CRM domain-containing protein n=1 Tax=Kalanchoe fedtschenkoi TaxID=63787 RepID=A0A7N0VCW8_KALFE
MLLSHSSANPISQRLPIPPISFSLNPANDSLRLPAAPWMKPPVLPRPDDVLLDAYRAPPSGARRQPDCVFTGKIVGRRGERDVKRIAQSLEKLQKRDDCVGTDESVSVSEEDFRFGGVLDRLKERDDFEEAGGRVSVEDFSFRFRGVLDKLKERDDSEEVEESVSVEDFDFRLGGMLDRLKERGGGDLGNKVFKMPWDKREGGVFLRRVKKERVVSKADMSLDGVLLERLRNEARRMRKWVKVKKAGVTQVVVDEIKLIWRHKELVMVKFDVPLCRNMDRAHEIVEMKTGGLVVWTYKDSLVVYRGADPILSSNAPKAVHRDFSKIAAALFTLNLNYTKGISHNRISPEIGEHSSLPLQLNENSQLFTGAKEGCESECVSSGGLRENGIVVTGSLYERETDRLLEGLGPRYADWWMSKPLPVDGDLLPEVIPGYRPPPRRSPPYGKSSISDYELTYLRELAQPLPTHFVLGRNRKLQGLASAIVKLWEKTPIVKISIKWGAINTKNERMANELKGLTGGVLLLRNKYLIILYRGNDFLPSGVANLIMDRDTVLMECQLLEEEARLRAGQALSLWDSISNTTSALGTLSEHQTIGTVNILSVKNDAELRFEAEKQKLEKELRIQEHKLFFLNKKIKRSAAELSELNSNWTPSTMSADAEIITEEERECLMKIALKMSRSLVLGRRGIFDGVIEGIHQHWKYREVVKVITTQRQFSQVLHTATMLEAESRGVLVSIKKFKKGHAIVLYRGKNYKRPSMLETKNLLTKREALLRSIEMQRLGSLKYFATLRQRRITDLRCKMEDIEKRIQATS